MRHMTAWSFEDTRSAGSSAGVVNGRPAGCPSDGVEVDEGRETASARKAASRSAHVEVEITRGGLESREARKDEASLWRWWYWSVWSRHRVKEVTKSSKLATAGAAGASGCSKAGPGIAEGRLRSRRAAVARRMARASSRPARSVVMTSVTTSAGGPRGSGAGEVAGVECRVPSNSWKKASAAGVKVISSYCRGRASCCDIRN